MNTELKVLEQEAIAAARFIRAKHRSLRSKIDKKLNTNKLNGLDKLNKEFTLYDHDRHTMRKELRLMNLARAYLSGKDYLTVENWCHTQVNSWDLWCLTHDYSTTTKPTFEDIEEWLGYEDKL